MGVRRHRLADPEGVPLLRILREDGGGLCTPSSEGLPLLPEAEWLPLFRAMLQTRLLDERMMKLQRQGRVGFVGAATGQEAAIHGSAAAFEAEDWVFSALREGGAALQRGMPLLEYVAHMFGNAEDTAKGRQMPNHFQSRAAHFPSWSSVLGTQLPHAVGVALAFRRRGEPRVVCAYSGDGATSSNGFHSALNLAGVFRAPVVFVVVDNGWAISVPSSRQTAARSYGSKARAYGMPGFDVDGNDPLACYGAVRAAAERARAGEGPSLVALRCYRLGGHSSSDDPSRYRDPEELAYWEKRDPLERFARFLEERGLLDSGLRESMTAEIRARIAAEIERALAIGPPPLRTLVEDVYSAPPRHLRRQVIETLRIIAEKGEAEAVAGRFPL